MTTRFHPGVLAPDPERRSVVLSWLTTALEAVDPCRLVERALTEGHPSAVLAMGKAAPGMVRGAVGTSGAVTGLCVTDHHEPGPPGIPTLVGDHPVPGPASLTAGEACLDLARRRGEGLVVLLSGGGSALAEKPRPGVPWQFVVEAYRTMLRGGLSVTEMNLVRGHLSALKHGGLARAAGLPLPTLVISDVAGADPSTVASGPTLPHPHQPDLAISLLEEIGLGVPAGVARAMATEPGATPVSPVTLLADALDAAQAVARAHGPGTMVRSEWLRGPVERCLDEFFELAGPGLSLAVGEPSVPVRGGGRGGRNTHAALLAATHIAGTDTLFAAFATDGVDGPSGAAGAVVDGATLRRGGDPRPALAGYDSAPYLEATSDLLLCPPTGTNVSDLWMLWRNPGTAS